MKIHEMTMHILHTALSATIIATLAHAPVLPAPAPAGAEGVWQGTIGTMPVIACLHARDSELQGSYYYLKHLVPIPLAEKAPGQPGGGMTLSENLDAPANMQASWTLASPAATRMNGTWKGNGKSFPITLTRLALTKDEQLDSPCGSGAFNGPREKPGTIRTSEARLAGTAYQLLTLDVGKHMDAVLTSFNLAGSGPAVSKVNDQLRKRLLAEQDMVFECARGMMAEHPQTFEYGSRTTPVMITARWLVAEETSSAYCGGAHPNYGIGHVTWDLATGSVADPARWLAPAKPASAPAAEETGADQSLPPALDKLVARAWTQMQKDAPDCKDAVTPGETSWALHPTPAGMAFTPQLPHAVHACVDDVVVAWPKVLPFMNSAGKAAVASLLADLKAR